MASATLARKFAAPADAVWQYVRWHGVAKLDQYSGDFFEKIEFDGDVEQAITLDWEGFQALPQREFSADLHCVTRWSKLGTLWRGVAVSVLADLVRPVADPVYVQARADGNYTANLRLVDMLGDKAFVATEFDGKPLSVEHGGPARLVVPDLYLWKSAKWLRGLHFSPYDYKGFWEKLGYHNYGDPWKEQRYRG